MITLDQAKRLEWRDELYHVDFKNANGTPQRFRVNGKVKTWKRDPGRVRIPIKRGLYQTGELTNGTCEGGSETYHLNEMCLTEAECNFDPEPGVVIS